MPPSKSKSKQVLEYLYRYAIEKGTSEVIEAVVPHGKIGMILWEVGYNVYEIMSNASEEDKLAILNEIQKASPQEVERLSDELSNDPNVIYPIALTEDERKAIARGIYQTLRQIPKQKTNSQQLLQSINQGLFGGKTVLSAQNVHVPHTQGVGNAVVKTLVNGNGLDFGFAQRPKVEFLAQYPVINGFEIKGVLGEGAYAQVYLANEQLENGKWRTCALKVGVLDSEKRFKREVQNMKQINHPHILSCWNIGRFEEQGVNKYWISMPNMGRLTLENLIFGNSLDLETKLLILMQIADALEALHQKKIVHRDLKPSNCLISSDFELKISDFGLSKDLNNKIDASQSINTDAIGTPAYMSPENIDGNIGFYSDVWAFGVIALELFTGSLPWGREINPLVLVGNIRHVDIDVQKLLEPFKLPTKLVEILAKCLKRDIKQRYRDGIELKKVFYHVAKEERNRLKHNRFRISWHILVENQLIETCMLHQVENGFTDLPIEIFLAMPEVSVLPLVLDHERLGDVLGVISRVSREIVLEEAVRNQKEYADLNKNRERLEREKKAEIERVDREMTESLKLIPHDQIVQMLAKLSEERDRKKENVRQHFMLLDQKMVQNSTNHNKILDEKVAVIRNRLKIEIQDELKDFDQLMTEQRKKEIERQARKRVWIKNIFLLGMVLSVMGGLWVWNEQEKEKIKGEEEAIIASTQADADAKAKADADAKAKADADAKAKADADAKAKAKADADKAQINHIREELQFIFIKGGSFLMGSEKGTGASDEKPMHRVSIKNFYMSKTEVTVRQYRKCVDAGVCSEPHWNDGSCYIWGKSLKQGILGKKFQRENQPIVCVDWKQARAFAKWVGGDLPSEAQWEYASRSGGKDITYPWGNEEATCEYAVMGDPKNWDDASSRGCKEKISWEVCSKTRGNTSQGLCDMAGNVWEWVLDEWHESYSGAPSSDIGWCSESNCDSNTSAHRVFRGGGWDSIAYFLRSSFRYNSSPSGSPDGCSNLLGFRVSDSRSLNAKLEAEQILKEEEAERLKLETERLAKLEAERLKLETERLAKLEAERLAKEKQKKLLQINDLRKELKFILIEGGSFMMGSDAENNRDEIPIHSVRVKDFYMSKTEVTVGQYRKCVDAGICSKPNDKDNHSNCNWGYSDRDDHPINCVDWKQARTFAKWVGGDLPSEAQWEYASRSGGRDIKYPWGNTEATCAYAVMGNPNDWNDNGCRKEGTWEVCSKTEGNTTQELCDMAGNVWEWVLDEWHNSYSGAPSDDIGWCSDSNCDINMWGSINMLGSSVRVFRGGSWYDNHLGLRSAFRDNHSLSIRDSQGGFRVSDTSPLNP